MKIKSNHNQEIILSVDAPKIISELMKKYNIVETKEEFLEKVRRGEATYGKKIANILREVIEGKISPENFVSVLQQQLNIEEEIAKKLAEDLKVKILAFVEKKLEEKEEIILTQKLSIKKPQTPPKEPPKTQDIYREPIE
jgi:hypothetical protein